ncbi:MAG: CocE/NonD family hydrolase [Planctomycetota bacterium]
MQTRRWIEFLSCLPTLLWAACVVPAVRAEEPTTLPTRADQVRPLPAPLAGFSDEGTFWVYKDEERLITINFKWFPDGTFENASTLCLAGQTVPGKLRIQPAPDGVWSEISMETPTGPTSIIREGELCRITRKDEIETVTVRPNMVLFENFAPALMSQVVRIYDSAEGGRQTFPLFILPKRVMEASLERLDTVERSIGGRDVKFTRYRYGLPGVDVVLWTDDQSRLYLADVPAQHAAYVREGYELLRLTPETDPLLSKAQYEVTLEHGLGIPMRDGVALATDLYRPSGDGRFPVILARTPYQKEMAELQARYFARRGYVFAVQDCRGRFSSPGTWEPFVNEPEDGYDAIEWLAVQPWSTGKVGMIGASYQGWVQWWAASRRPPHLVTIIPSVSPSDPYFNIPYDHGVFFLSGAIWWADILESEATADLSGAAFSRIEEKDYHKLLRSLPVVDLDKAVLGKENLYWRQWIAHPTNDAYWERASFLERLQDVNIPVFHQSGWFDGDGIGTKLNYLRMASHGHPYQKLVLGPWGHTPVAQRRYGDRDFGPEAIVDLQEAYLRWFDHWLKSIDNGIANDPLVSVFVMGSNRWLHSSSYPIPGTRSEKWYLSSGGRANTSRGDGWLVKELPAAEVPPDRYTYDPADPTPDPLFYDEPDDQDESGEKRVRAAEEKKKARDAYHAEVTQSRRDILVYESARFREPYTFAGPISAVLFAASSARDTDWFVRLVEVDAEGKLFALVGGKLRARYRNSMTTPERLEPGKVYEYHLDLWQTGITIPPGHRLRVEIASAAFPSFSRNLNTGGHNETDTDYVAAQQTVYHDAEHPSHVLLPALPDMETRR